jgi:hypothetical protein
MSLWFGIKMWHNRQAFGVLGGKGWDECFDPEDEQWEPGREFPLDFYICPCCGNKSLLTRYNEECCEWCEWVDNKVQEDKPDLAKARNKMSLNQARNAWREKQK